MTTCPGSPVKSAAAGHTGTASPKQDQAGLLAGTHPWSPKSRQGRSVRPQSNRRVERSPLGRFPGTRRLPSSPPTSAGHRGHGAHGGNQPRGLRAHGGPGAGGRCTGPGRASERGARLTCRRRSCHRSPPCSAGRASCCGLHACLHGKEKHRLAMSWAPDVGAPLGGPGLASV